MNSSVVIDINELRIGMYIQLDMGWMRHPFPVSSFRVTSTDQIDTLRELGLKSIRYLPHKSDLAVVSGSPKSEDVAPPLKQAEEAVSGTDDAVVPAQTRLQAQMDDCDAQFERATRQYVALEGCVAEQPAQARALADALVADCVKNLLDNGESVIRLLSEGVGERSALHPVNVLVVSLLLGKAIGLCAQDLHGLGSAALVHDVGKMRLPPTLAHADARMTPTERARYETHVVESVAAARRMEYPLEVLTAVMQHHEMADGSGFPRRSVGEEMSRWSHVLALVNRYDRLCNPAVGGASLTPHEALSLIFSQQKPQFDPLVLGAFIRMMGVYPPGSVVQLVNDRYAIVVSVNSARPLRPKVMVYDERIPKDQAVILDLEKVPELGVRRSLKPSQLPRDAMEYLSPRQRICYFFERAVPLPAEDAE